MPRFLERDEAEREPPCPTYPWDGVRNVRPFSRFQTSVTEGVYWHGPRRRAESGGNDLGLKLALLPPATRVETVTDTLHGVAVTDDYRWLEGDTSDPGPGRPDHGGRLGLDRRAECLHPGTARRLARPGGAGGSSSDR